MNNSSISLPILELKPALAGLGKVVSRTATLPVLTTLRIDRDPDGWITLTGTDLDTTVSVRLEQAVEGPPTSLLLPFHDLSRIVKTCGPRDVLTVVSVGPATVSVRHPIGASFAEQQIESFAPDEFPSTPKVEGEPCALDEVVRASFLEALQCCSSDESRLILNGVYLDVSQKGKTSLAATDGRHLYTSAGVELNLGKSVLIPHRKFLAWKAFAADGDWQLRMSRDQTEGFVRIQSAHWTFTTRLIEGEYPNYRQVIPDESQFNTRFTIPPESMPSLMEVIVRMPCPDQENLAVGLRIHEGKLSVLGRNAPTDRFAEVPFSEAQVTGADVTVFMNRHYLLKALGFGLNDIRLMDHIAPALFRREDRQMVVMPVRIHDFDPQHQAAPQTNGTAVEPPTSTGFATAEPPPPKPERNTMQKNGNNDDHTKTALESALEHGEALKASLKTTIGELNTLLDSLRQVQREKKTTEKEVQSVRSTLEKLQSVKL